MHEVIHIIHKVYIKFWGKLIKKSTQKFVLLKTHKLFKIAKKYIKYIDKKIVRKFLNYVEKFAKNDII